MAQEYTVEDVRPRDYKDRHNNTWCDVAFKEVGEPVVWVMKDPSKARVGDKVYGSLTDEKTQNGDDYQRFRREQKPETNIPENVKELIEETVGDVFYSKKKSEQAVWDKKDAYIRMQWAYRESLAHFHTKDVEVDMEDVRKLAKGLVRMVDEDVEEYLGRSL